MAISRVDGLSKFSTRRSLSPSLTSTPGESLRAQARSSFEATSARKAAEPPEPFEAPRRTAAWTCDGPVP
jgi:hypothetical protein